jgi:hypothetical protein
VKDRTVTLKLEINSSISAAEVEKTLIRAGWDAGLTMHDSEVISETINIEVSPEEAELIESFRSGAGSVLVSQEQAEVLISLLYSAVPSKHANSVYRYEDLAERLGVDVLSLHNRLKAEGKVNY